MADGTPPPNPYEYNEQRLRDWLSAALAQRTVAAILAVLLGFFGKLLRTNADLTLRLSKARAPRPRSERTAFLRKQLPLFAQERAAQEAQEPPKPKPTRTKAKDKKPRAKGYPAPLPRERVEHPATAQERRCPTCGAEMCTLCFRKQRSEDRAVAANREQDGRT